MIVNRICKENENEKLVKFIFEDQATDWISISQQVATVEDLKSIARTMKNMPAEFSVFSEGQPLECLSGLGPSNVIRVL